MASDNVCTSKLRWNDTTFSNPFDTKYRGKNFTDTDSDTDANPYRHMVAILCHLLLQVKHTDKVFKC